MAKDFPKGFSVCFHCNQTSHWKVECPQLTHGSAQAFAPVALHVTDGQPVKAEAPSPRGRSFQMIAEEVRAAPDIVAGMYLLIYDIVIICLCLYCVLYRYFPCELCACFSVI